ncbi:MAG: hypothetical protein ABF670_05060 [Liquorilactobacillus ghanensis]
MKYLKSNQVKKVIVKLGFIPISSMKVVRDHRGIVKPINKEATR